MHALLTIALKSVVISALALALLALTKQRSSAERSLIAHVGLLALVTLALAPLVLPSWNVEAPALFATTDAPTAGPATLSLPAATAHREPTGSSVTQAALPPATASVATSSISWTAAALAAYAVPAAILLFITLLALARLLALRARADVLVDGHWLSALARAQRRMGFKHGTALLTSNELGSPISWGLMRPVILLNERAVQASGEAEAIIAHELAHVARLDWAKLLLARIATALFWFNPLVWLLAREAHQLREETADDAVLASDIADTDYAELLVGVARHECSGLLLGAHGVAPSKSSLARRVARVLDSASARGPVARPFAFGVFVGAVAIAAPLAALTLSPARADVSGRDSANGMKAVAAGQPIDTGVPYHGDGDDPRDLPHIIAQGVSSSVATAVAAVRPTVAIGPGEGDIEAVSPNGSTVKSVNGVMVSTAPSGATVTIYPPDRQGRRKVVALNADGARAVTYADENDPVPGFTRPPGQRDAALDDAIELRAAGVSSEYARDMIAVAPQLRNASVNDLVGLKASGVTPGYVRGLIGAGYRNLDADELEKAYTLGVTPDYLRGVTAAGYPDLPLDQISEMRAVGLTPADIARFRSAGYGRPSIEKLIELKAIGDGHGLARPPRPPRPPGSSSDEGDDGG
ncbi:M56 family metallopeptidase [Sphingomonas sp.]|uniref:M56 family metallopeptidase n=1 Tax=Sphingomonas sp. TaxID=28214 RepID=UPI0025CE2077|nr:M56 family metallopeptidase [Sphingomonas sp.]MBV9526912.1 M56 family metallopeptidase [Sphingomonas sp.]